MNTRKEQYTDFAEKVKRAVQSILGDEFTINVHMVTKNNGTKKMVLQIINEIRNAFPVVYLDTYYERYTDGERIEILAYDIVKFYKSAEETSKFDVEKIGDFSQMKQHIMFKLINTKRNQELLKTIPHIDFLDLSIVFYELLEMSEKGRATMLIDNEIMKIWNTEVKALFQIAYTNTKESLSVEMMDMEEFIDHICEAGFIPENLLETGIIGKNIPEMYILSNQFKTDGAGCILFPEILENLGEIMADDFWVIPSSVHEVIIVPFRSGFNVDEMSAMVREVNDSVVEEEEILSDRAYYYLRKSKELWGDTCIKMETFLESIK